MARALYESDPAFRADVDECSRCSARNSASTCATCSIPSRAARSWPRSDSRQTAVTQPALFVIEYALAMAWRRLGIEPEGMIGHSVGEYVAACLGGVFTRDDALRLVAERGRLMQALPEGTMLAVRASARRVRELLPDDLEIAAENAPDLTVVSGETAAIEAFEARLAERERRSTPPRDLTRLPLRDDGSDPRRVRRGRGFDASVGADAPVGLQPHRRLDHARAGRRTARTGWRRSAGPSSSRRGSRGSSRTRRG